MGEQPANSSADTSAVQIRIAADLGQLPTLRALAETIALLGDFTLDEVSDVRLAVDEVASILILDAVPGTVLSCEFVVDDTGMRVKVSAASVRAGLPDQAGFGWHVLRTLTDSIVATQHPEQARTAGYPTTVEFSRVRGNSSAG